MNIEEIFSQAVRETVSELYGADAVCNIQIQKTRKEFEGDYTIVVFPFLRVSHLSPEATADQLGKAMIEAHPKITNSYNVVKGFLNLTINSSVWTEALLGIWNTAEYGRQKSNGRNVMIEYSSPNTNKPLHLGHIRNNLLGYSVARIMDACGYNVIKANLVNDRGIHICKSMVAWLRYGEGATPQSTGMKGDHLVGDYYVCFDKHYKAEVKELMDNGADEETAKRSAPIMLEAQEMLRKWEAGDNEVRALWEKMNGWVYEGFDTTYKALGVSFDKVYYESQTYILGKEIVRKGLDEGVFYRREDGSVWIDLRNDGLDEKLLLRSDGTSVYMTQDLGTALKRFEENSLDEMIYVVGNEQNYHFQVLKLVLKKLGYKWSDEIFHLSYGMVELPNGKMKSREGTVVDADDLMDEMVATAREMSDELGKLDGCTDEEISDITHTIGLGALKYFILKVDPRKTILFDPKESIDFNGNTGPFIQYTYARIRSIIRKAGHDVDTSKIENSTYALIPEEIEIVKNLAAFPSVVKDAGEKFSPALIANYAYELCKQFNGYYHDHTILGEAEETARETKLAISAAVARTIKYGMGLLGISVPERM